MKLTPSCDHPKEDGCMHCCERCNYDRHVCNGCGDYLPHGKIICDECSEPL